MNPMITVTVDIAGMYFRTNVTVDGNSSIEEVMTAVEVATAAAPIGTAKLLFRPEYSLEVSGLRTLNTITVIHSGDSAKSRQTTSAPGYQKRAYADGIYSFTDDGVIPPAAGAPLRLYAKDPNKTVIHSWQYYVYSRDGVEYARLKVNEREIVPFSAKPSVDAGAVQLVDGDVIVWRLVGIFVRPTHAEENQLPAPEVSGEAYTA